VTQQHKWPNTKAAQVQGYSLDKHKDSTSTKVQPRQTQRQHKFNGTAYINTNTAQIQGYNLDKHKDSTSTRIQPRQTQRQHKYKDTA